MRIIYTSMITNRCAMLVWCDALSNLSTGLHDQLSISLISNPEKIYWVCSVLNWDKLYRGLLWSGNFGRILMSAKEPKNTVIITFTQRCTNLLLLIHKTETKGTEEQTGPLCMFTLIFQPLQGPTTIWCSQSKGTTDRHSRQSWGCCLMLEAYSGSRGSSSPVCTTPGLLGRWSAATAMVSGNHLLPPVSKKVSR